MKIIVVCPKCRKRFEVSEKFAGKSGPCPQCKNVLKVPEVSEQVVIHAPEEFDKGGRSQSGQLVLKPISRTETKFRPLAAAALAAGVLAVFLVAWFGGRQDFFKSYPWITRGALVLLSPVLAAAGYSFLRDDELEPYRGLALWLRAAICGGVYAVLWAVFGHVAASGVITGDLLPWLIVIPPFVAVGATAAAFSLDLDFGSAAFHYAFYLLITVLLRGTAGLGWIWNVK
ncbi:MAG: hypothetical protein JXB10_14560 [Pirellulales bacterium]|nr:hypothetical protein [Pirellulales bacterium]